MGFLVFGFDFGWLGVWVFVCLWLVLNLCFDI